MSKYKVKKIKGVRVVEEIRKDSDRPKFPRPAIFRNKKAYDRKRLGKPSLED